VRGRAALEQRGGDRRQRGHPIKITSVVLASGCRGLGGVREAATSTSCSLPSVTAAFTRIVTFRPRFVRDRSVPHPFGHHTVDLVRAWSVADRPPGRFGIALAWLSPVEP
jgi:hypothetical protein